MLFNSTNFALFLPIVFFGYWFIFNKHLKTQNTFLLLASYFFYGCWDWRFVFLLLFSTLLDFYAGIKIADTANHKAKKFWLWLSICINVGFLAFFKYFNFRATQKYWYHYQQFCQLGFRRKIKWFKLGFGWNKGLGFW